MPTIAMAIHVRIPALPFAANFNFSRAAARLAFAATAAHRTRGFISECGADLVSRRFSSAVATCTIAVARGVAIVASQGGHTAPPANFRDSDPGSCVCQTEAVGGSGQVCPLPGLSRTGTPACPRAVWRYCAGQPTVSVLPSNLSNCSVGAAFSQTRISIGPDFPCSQEKCGESLIQSGADLALQAALQIKNWGEGNEHEEDCAVVCHYTDGGVRDNCSDESDGWRA